MELFAAVGYAKAERARVLQWLPAIPSLGSRRDTYFPVLARVPASSAA
jgi:hypothetical protein